MGKFYNSDKGLVMVSDTKSIIIYGDKGKRFINEDELMSIENKTKIKRQKFNELKNIYYSNIKEEWEYKGEKYRNLPNFDMECTNYKWHQLPKYKIGYNDGLILVYHQGDVFYFNWSYGGYPNGQLFSTKDNRLVKWVKPKNCAPIFNINKKQIV